MSDCTISNKFSAMNVAGLKQYLRERGITVNGYLKPALVIIASAVEKMMLPVNPNFECDDAEKNLKQRLIIHDVCIEDPFTLPMENNFINTPPFGLFDIFNHLIYHSTDYDKQGLASYKSYDDYRLFDDGYVESLSTTHLKECGIHVYVGKVYPTMRSKTHEGKDCYELWFILEGKGPNRGSVIDAFCKCIGGRDGGCKHVAAAMYSLEFLCNSQAKDSVTSGPCLWQRKPRSSIQPCEVKDLNISKCKYKLPATTKSKKRKREYNWLQNIDHDPREKRFRKEWSHNDMLLFTNRMQSKVVEDKSTRPAVFPLLHKLYLQTNEPDMTEVTNCTKKCVGIMERKTQQFINNMASPTPKLFLQYLSWTDAEIENVETSTVGQWQSQEWFTNKVGFITASKCKAVYTRQTTLNRTKSLDITALAKSIISKPTENLKTSIPNDPHNPRDWGLKKEDEARRCYSLVAGKLHYKLKLDHKGFIISKDKPFMGASIDDLRSCECPSNCGNAVVEYKCPWVHRNSDPKEAFVSHEVGGVLIGNSYHLKNKSRYYYQVQMQMFVVDVHSCDFVVWTMKGIHHTTIMFEPSFMCAVCIKLEKFWVTQIASLLLTSYTEDANQQTPNVTADTNKAPSEDKITIVSSQAVEPHAPSFHINGIDVTKHDIETLGDGKMLNDKMVSVLLEELQCQFPIIDSLFYSILCGEQDGMHISRREERFKAAGKFLKIHHLSHDFIIIPIVRSNHWLLAVLTPWHILWCDSLSWDVSYKQFEINRINSYLKHLCLSNNIDNKYSNLTHVSLKVPRQPPNSNSCGFFIVLFLEYFLKELEEYENNPNGYIEKEHRWFSPEEAQEKRCKAERHWDTFHYLQTQFGNN